MPHPILIVGAGMAGHAMVRELRRAKPDAQIVWAEASETHLCAKPSLSAAFGQKKGPRELAGDAFEEAGEKLGALAVSSSVLSFDPERPRALMGDGTFLEFSTAVLAVGASPIRPPLAGSSAHELMSVNGLSDYRKFRERLALLGPNSPVGSVVLVCGAGLVGCELADDLAGAGAHPILVDPTARPLSSIATEHVSLALRDAMQVRGSRFLMGRKLTALEPGTTRALRAVFDDASTEDVDCAVGAVGLIPNLELAHSAKLATARGIIVDEFGSCSRPGFYALGDCSQFGTGPNAWSPFVAPLLASARAIAQSLSGVLTSINRAPWPVVVKTPSCPIALIPPPGSELAGGHWVHATEEGRPVSRFYRQDGVLIGFCLAQQTSGSRGALMAELAAARG